MFLDIIEFIAMMIYLIESVKARQLLNNILTKDKSLNLDLGPKKKPKRSI